MALTRGKNSGCRGGGGKIIAPLGRKKIGGRLSRKKNAKVGGRARAYQPARKEEGCAPTPHLIKRKEERRDEGGGRKE